MHIAQYMNEFEEYTFPNGIRLVHKQVSNTKIAHCGFVLDIGSRDEQPAQMGIAHFWEHMAFKGTQKRKTYHILSSIDSVGGELNAYTTKEKICFYASLLDNYFDKAVEILTDITFFSIFPEKELNKERGVILEEMSMYLDDPGDHIQDMFDEVIFGADHPLGYNILGVRETVQGFQREDFQTFLDQHLDTSKIIFSVVSAIPFKKVLKTVEKYLRDIPTKQAVHQRKPFVQYYPQHITLPKPITQAHCAIGTTSYSLYDENRIPFFMLVNLLGGPGMNSRLNLAIRERYGFVYSIDANMNSFQDTGLFSIHFATEQSTLKRCVSLVYQELKKLREKKLGTLQLHAAKQQLMGQMAMAEESNMGIMLMLGKSLLDLNRVDSLPILFDKIKSVSAELVLELANEMLSEDRLSMLSFVPEEAEQDARQ